MVASCEVLPVVALVSKARVSSPRNPVVGRQWSRSLGLVEKEGKSKNLGIVVSLVRTLGGMVEPLGFWVVAGAVVAGVGLSVVAPASEKMVRMVRGEKMVRVV